MALVPLGIFFGGIITGVPVVTGVAEGVSHQRKVNEDAADDERMVKFWITVESASEDGEVGGEVCGGRVVIEGGKLWVLPPTSPKTGHPFTGFFIPYPDEARSPPERGLVSTISDDPPMLNWIYIDKTTLEVKHGNRTGSIQHVVGDWDWTAPEKGEKDKKRNITLEGWEGFVAVEEPVEKRVGGLKWALYFDRADDGLKTARGVKGRRKVEVELVRTVLPEELRRRQEEEADQKMRVKQSGDLKTTLNLRDEKGKLSKV